MSLVILPRELQAQLVAWSAARAPREACGVLVGSPAGAAIEIAHAFVAENLAVGEDAFTIDPGAIVAAAGAARDLGLEIVGFWHSHPDGAAVPSSRDAQCADLARSWSGLLCAVVGARGSRRVRVWHESQGAFVEDDLVESTSCAARFLDHNSRSPSIAESRST